jgi:hypothetical protein
MRSESSAESLRDKAKVREDSSALPRRILPLDPERCRNHEIRERHETRTGVVLALIFVSFVLFVVMDQILSGTTNGFR